jgi:hypothetical protein
MKIQSSLLVLAAMVGSATAANKRNRVFKIYSREEIQAADGTRSLQQGGDDTNSESEAVSAVSSMSMTSAPSASTIVSPTPASEPPTANPTAPTTDQLPQESLPSVVVAQNEGDRCGTTEDAECAGSLKCGKKSYWDETYVCCKDTFVPFGWVTDLCVAQNEGDRCGTTEDAECAGSLECGKRSKSDETYVCCKDTFVPFGWVTDLCVGSVQNEGDRCGTTEDAECAGSLKCGKKSYWDETYVCCKDTFVPFGWVTDLCVAQNEGDRCGTTEDAECAGSLECGKRSKSDETYVCCKDTYVPWFWFTDVCL